MELKKVAIVDWGNTRVKLALIHQKKYQIDAFKHGESREILNRITQFDPDAILIAGSGEVNQDLQRDISARFLTIVFNANTPLPIDVDYDSRATVGSDRLANCVQAYSKHPGRDVITVDLGTCITYDILRENTFVGGVISPGLWMRSRAMNQFTARLPEVTIPKTMPGLIGTSTIEALQSGAKNGWMIEIFGMIENMEAKLSDPVIVLTGGDLPHFDRALKSTIFADPYWTIKGYEEILRFNAM